MTLHHARRCAQALAVLALAAGGLSACGSDSGDGSSAPSGVSTTTFCDTYTGYLKEIASAGTTDVSKLVPSVKKFAAQLNDLGTPSDIPADARRGFEASIKAANELPDDATLDDITKLEGDVSDADQKDTQAFGTYVEKTCPDLLSAIIPSDLPTDALSGLGSDFPSDLPTDLGDLPSDFPTDLPTDLSGLPTDFPTDLLSDLPTDFPS